MIEIVKILCDQVKKLLDNLRKLWHNICMNNLLQVLIGFIIALVGTLYFKNQSGKEKDALIKNDAANNQVLQVEGQILQNKTTEELEKQTQEELDKTNEDAKKNTSGDADFFNDHK